MQTRKLGNLTVSEIGMGCMSFSHGYGQIPDESYSIEAIRKAYEYGCTFFDTAETYGPQLLPQNHGHNEKLVGKALKDVRSNVVIATKLHLPTDEARQDGVYETLKHHLTASLDRLQTDYADLYYLHRINPNIPIKEVAAGMGKLIDEGLIKGWGMSQIDVQTLRKAHEVTSVSAVQNLYNMLERDDEKKLIPYCLTHQIGYVPFSPIASGFLSGKVTTQTDFSNSDDVRKFVPQLSKDNIKANQPILQLLEKFSVEKQATKAQISLAWMLKKYANLVPIPGSKNQERILENLQASEVDLTDDEFQQLEHELDQLTIHGHRGSVESEITKMSDWK